MWQHIQFFLAKPLGFLLFPFMCSNLNRFIFDTVTAGSQFCFIKEQRLIRIEDSLGLLGMHAKSHFTKDLVTLRKSLIIFFQRMVSTFPLFILFVSAKSSGVINS